MKVQIIIINHFCLILTVDWYNSGLQSCRCLYCIINDNKSTLSLQNQIHTPIQFYGTLSVSHTYSRGRNSQIPIRSQVLTLTSLKSNSRRCCLRRSIFLTAIWWPSLLVAIHTMPVEPSPIFMKSSRNMRGSPGVTTIWRAARNCMIAQRSIHKFWTYMVMVTCTGHSITHWIKEQWLDNIDLKMKCKLHPSARPTETK